MDENVLYVKHTGAPYESVAVGLFKDLALMGIFHSHLLMFPLVIMILVKFDPWLIPSLDLVDTRGKVMSLSPAETNYVEIISASPLISSNRPILRTSINAYSQSRGLVLRNLLIP